mgnify:CR=1 FL=1
MFRPSMCTPRPACVRAAARSTASSAGKGGSGERANIARRRLPLIEEGGLTFAVNFDDYLDVGIFLDHRVTRNLVREHAKQARRFLNLFAYTGTATCYAADGGVEETVTVDLSTPTWTGPSAICARTALLVRSIILCATTCSPGFATSARRATAGT